MRRRYVFPVLAAWVLLAALSEPAQAYLGPGAGISLVGSLWRLLGVIGLALLYVVLWSLRRLLRRRRQRREEGQKASAASVAETEAEETWS